jgi:peroxiredoxin
VVVTTARLSATSPSALSPLAAGSTAPPFALRCSQHCAATLDDYRGKPLVLVFYVADWHPVCTAQLERYRDLAPELERLGADLVAISPDTFWSHAAFARAHRLPFLLLSDDTPRGAIARAYGVYDARKELPRRGLFVVDSAGTVAWGGAYPEALDPGIDDVLTALETLGPPRVHPARTAEGNTFVDLDGRGAPLCIRCLAKSQPIGAA